ncbi:hypothetical protein [Ancylobacter vacuolatus]|uniref:hypothetical protein n=1 Tax=Ancylobacter vacuolatus TaxID=223389 RepID=UPI0027D85D92|nr:hypothetical protein [Ancylobacter vacuolatus]
MARDNPYSMVQVNDVGTINMLELARIHVEDAVAALLLALDAPAPARRVCTATGGTHVTLGEIGEMVKRVLPQADIVLAPGPDPVDEVHRRFDISAIARDLGYAPQFDLEAGPDDRGASARAFPCHAAVLPRHAGA